MTKLSCIVRVHLRVPLVQAQVLSSQLAQRAINSCSTTDFTISINSNVVHSQHIQQESQERDATITDTSFNTALSQGRGLWMLSTVVTMKFVKKLTTLPINLRLLMTDFRQVNELHCYQLLIHDVTDNTFLRHTFVLKGFPRPNFITGGFFGGKNVDGLYTRVTQRQTISEIVGSYDLAMKYIEETSDVFLGKA